MKYFLSEIMQSTRRLEKTCLEERKEKQNKTKNNRQPGILYSMRGSFKTHHK